MKILFISSNLNQFGGIQFYNRTFLSILREQEKNLTLVMLKDTRLISKIVFAIKIFFETLKNKPDVTFCSHIGFAPLCYFIRILLGSSYVVTLYGVDVSAKKSFLERKALLATKAIILIFKWTQQILLEQFPDLSNKIFYLPSPVDGTRFSIKEKPSSLKDRFQAHDKKILLTVARIDHLDMGNKGYEKVLQALPAVLKEVPNTKYILVGNGSKLPEMKDLAKKLNIEENVAFASAVSNEELPDYYNLADIFVMPSRNEGFGIVFLEALISGCQVIAGQYSKEELLNGELGTSVDPLNQQELEDAIISLLKTPPPPLKSPQKLREKTLALYGLDMFRSRAVALLKYIDLQNK